MRHFLLILLSSSMINLNAQFKQDNVTYKTVFPEDLCKTLKENAGYKILDVRSDGEYNDTSISFSLNIGRIKNSLHINITELPNRWKELLPYKDQPLFIYCSHSQRSRRASRLLADSGFTKIFNINGGLTDFYYQSLNDDPCAAYTVVSSTPYKIISPKQLDENVKNNTEYFIIDIRKDSAFKGISNSEKEKTEGRFEKAINIPFQKIISMEKFDFPAKPILLVDQSGNESPQVAKLLFEKGFKDVSILFNGMTQWVDFMVKSKTKSSLKWKNNISYNILSADEFSKIAGKTGIEIIDLRSIEEFTNQSKNYWQNIGNVKNAINIPTTKFENNTDKLPASKHTTIILYAFSNQPEVYETAKKIKEKGYGNVNILYGGIWNLRWASHNIKGMSHLNDWVVNVPAENE